MLRVKWWNGRMEDGKRPKRTGRPSQASSEAFQAREDVADLYLNVEVNNREPAKVPRHFISKSKSTAKRACASSVFLAYFKSSKSVWFSLCSFTSRLLLLCSLIFFMLVYFSFILFLHIFVFFFILFLVEIEIRSIFASPGRASLDIYIYIHIYVIIIIIIYIYTHIYTHVWLLILSVGILGELYIYIYIYIHTYTCIIYTYIYSSVGTLGELLRHAVDDARLAEGCIIYIYIYIYIYI